MENIDGREEAAPSEAPTTLQKIERLIEHSPKTEKAEDAFSMVFDAIESATSAILISDSQGDIIYVNPSFLRIFEYAGKAEVLGKSIASLFASDEIRHFTDLISIIDAAEGETEEFLIVGKSERRFAAEVIASNVTNSQGMVVGRMASFTDISKRKALEEERQRMLQKLQSALEKIKTLRGLVPICAACKSIRDDKGFWHRVEAYVSEHSEAVFTHGICPSCAEKLYPKDPPRKE